MSFWQELKRRNVFRVGAVYLAIAWLIAQVVSVINEPLSLPDGADTLIIVLLAAGFPIALMLAWALELTPDGVRLDDGAARKEPKTVTAGRMIDFAIIAALVAALGLTLWNRDGPAPENSIAVLPFTNQRDDPEQDYLSRGIASDIASRLITVDGLQVIGENSSFGVDASTGDYVAMGQALNVAYIVEGSFLKEGDRIRITTRLIRSADGVAIWTEPYEDEGASILDILPQVSITVARSLSSFLGFDESQLRYTGTDSDDAFDYFLKGRDLWFANPAQAIEEFTRAAQLDPTYAEPWAWMSSSYGLLVQRARTQQDFDRAYAAMINSANRAVELGPRLWDSHRALAWAHLADQDPVAANEAFMTAVDVARAQGVRSTFSFATWVEVFGHMDEAVEILEPLTTADPLNQENWFFLRNALIVMGRYEDAFAISRERLDVPVTPATHTWAFPWFIEQGRIRELQEFLASQPRGSLQYALAPGLTSPESATRLIRDWQQSPGYKTRYDLIDASLYAGYFGDTDFANQLLRDAFLTDGWGGYFLMWHEVLSETRQTPEFREFLRELGFVDLWRQTGEWNDYCRPLPGGDDFECV